MNSTNMVSHTQHTAQAPHISGPVVSVHANRGQYHARLEGGREVPVTRRQARALIAQAVQHWSFGIYSNWILSSEGAS